MFKVVAVKVITQSTLMDEDFQMHSNIPGVPAVSAEAMTCCQILQLYPQVSDKQSISGGPEEIQNSDVVMHHNYKMCWCIIVHVPHILAHCTQWPKFPASNMGHVKKQGNLCIEVFCPKWFQQEIQNSFSENPYSNVNIKLVLHFRQDNVMKIFG